MGAPFGEHDPRFAERGAGAADSGDHDRAGEGDPYARALALVGAGATARLLASGVASIAALAAIAVTLRLLGTSQYGILAFALSVVALVPDLGRIGVAAGAVRGISVATSANDVEGIRDVARGAFTATIALGLVGAAIVAVVLVSLDQLSLASRLVLGLGLGVMVLGTQFAVATSVIARGLGRVVAVEAPHTVQSVGRLVAVGILAWLGIDTLGAVAVAYAAVAVVAAVLAAVLARRLLGSGVSPFRPAPSSARRLLRLSLPFLVTGLAGFAIGRFDVVVLGLVRPSAEVGAYDPVLRAVERLLLLAPLLFAVQALGVATRMLARGDATAVSHLYHHLTKLGVILSLPAVLVLMAFPEPVLRMLYGAEFPIQPSLVWVLLIGFGVNLVFGMNGLFLGATGRGREIAIAGVASLVTMVVSAVVLIPAFGAVGAAAATSIAYVVLNVVNAWGLHRTTRIRPFRKDLVAILALSILPMAIVVLVRITLEPQGVWGPVAWSLGAWGVWVAAMFALGLLRGSDWRPLFASLRPDVGKDVV